MNWIAPNRLSKTGILGMNRRNIEYIGGYNDRRHFPMVDNKLTTKLLASDAGLAVPALIGVVQTQYAIQNLGESLDKLTDFVAKPAHGSGGKGILVVKGRQDDDFVKSSGEVITLTDIQRHLTNTISGLHSLGGRTDVAFLEQRVVVDDLFSPLSHKGVPDIRLIVFKGFPVMGMLRLATHASDGKANLHQGAIGVGIDIANGTAINAVQFDRLITHHPDTEADLGKISIPNWPALLKLAAQCYEVSELGYLGCDIVVDRTHGPLILELNARPGLSIQLANDRGLLPRLRQLESMDTRKMAIDERVEYSREVIAKL